MRISTSSLINSSLQQSLKPSFKISKESREIHVDVSLAISTKKILNADLRVVADNDICASIQNGVKEKCVILKKRSEDEAKKEEVEKPLSPLSLPKPKVVLFPPEEVVVGWKGPTAIGSGFVNLGTTCYINSTLQALFHVPCFANWLIDDKKHYSICERTNGMVHNDCLVCSMQLTLSASRKATGSCIRPRHVIEKVKLICKHLSSCRQEDAHEFLRYLMEGMEKSYLLIGGYQVKRLDSYSKETTPLNQIFGGYIRTEVTCLECGFVSTTFQHFQDLILDIRTANSVNEALDHYFGKEKLEGNDAYHCEKCKKKVSAFKKFAVEKAPNALCIQLKRFNANSFSGGGAKLCKSVHVHQTVDLTKYKCRNGYSGSQMLKYKLTSVIFHHGQSASSGHYTAMGLTSGGSYYYFNDEQVYSVSYHNYSHSSNAYIIFYELDKSCVYRPIANKPLETSSTVGMKASNAFSPTPITANGFSKGDLTTFKPPHEVKPTMLPTPIFKANGMCKSPAGKTPFKPLNKDVELPAPCSMPEIVSSDVKCENADKSASLVPYLSSDSSDNESNNNNNNNNGDKSIGKDKRGKSDLDKNKEWIFGSRDGIPRLSLGKVAKINFNIKRKSFEPLNEDNNDDTSPPQNGISGEGDDSFKYINDNNNRNGWKNGTKFPAENGGKRQMEVEIEPKSSSSNGRAGSLLFTNGKCHGDGNGEKRLVEKNVGSGLKGVQTWNGEKSILSRALEAEQRVLADKRRQSEERYDDDLDAGKVKKQKLKYENGQNGSYRGGIRNNPIQQQQNLYNNNGNGNSNNYYGNRWPIPRPFWNNNYRMRFNNNYNNNNGRGGGEYYNKSYNNNNGFRGGRVGGGGGGNFHRQGRFAPYVYNNCRSLYRPYKQQM